MFSTAAILGMLSLGAMLAATAYVFRQLGAEEVAGWIVGVALLGLLAALLGAALS